MALRVEELLEQAANVKDARERERTQALVREILAFEKGALTRLLTIARERGGSSEFDNAVALDPHVSSLLLLHDIHPASPQARIARALSTMKGVTLASLAEGTARIRLEPGFAPSRERIVTLLDEAAPDVEIMVEHADALISADRLVRRRTAHASASCELCGSPLSVTHEHLLEPNAAQLKCACEACLVLFGQRGETAYRRVARRAERLRDFAISDADWARLAIPVDMAFFVSSSARGRVVASYPSPAGPVESELPLDAWASIAASSERVACLELDVEALLVHRRARAPDAFIVSIDECYELVGRIRSAWRGLTGGDAVRDDVARFFSDLGARAEAAHA